MHDYSGKAFCLKPSFNCYDQKCHGTGNHTNDTIYCDNSNNHCNVNATGYPTCIYGLPGIGINCNGTSDNGTVFCMYDSAGKAMCATPLQKFLGAIIAGIVVGVVLLVSGACYGWRKRQLPSIVIINEGAEATSNYGATA